MTNPVCHMTDREILIWIHQRLVERHKESPYVDYMHALRDVIYGMPKDKKSRGDVVTMRSLEVLKEIRAMNEDKNDQAVTLTPESRALHKCESGSANLEGYGEAVTSCIERQNGELWVGNGEYGSQVNFCPFCGAKATAVRGVNHEN